MKKLILLAFAIFSFGCKSGRPTAAKMENKTATLSNELLGKQPVKVLFNAPYREWFSAGYENYKPDAATVSELKGLGNNISVTIFMGTWCGDSKEQVPHFYKILHEVGFEEKNVTLIMVDRNKTTPEKLETGLEISYVPTFIFYKTTRSGGRRAEGKREEKTKELNRIVESPVETLEKDMLRILSGQQYKHTYTN